MELSLCLYRLFLISLSRSILFVSRFSNSLLPLIVLAGIGSSIGFVFANPPEKIIYVPKTQTCLFPDSSDSPVFYVSVAAYVLVVVCQGEVRCRAFVCDKNLILPSKGG